MSIELLTVLMFALLILFLFSGLPIVFALGSGAIIFLFVLEGAPGLYMVATSAWAGLSDFVLVAVPLFILMGSILQTSGIADDLYHMMHLWFGRMRGGLAVGTVGICAIFAAMAGISAAATVTMGLVALPAMLKRGYDRNMAMGAIAAGGSLGIVIPPSLIMIIYCSVSGLSVGRYFAAGVFPGLLLAGLFMIYIIVRCAMNKDLGPSVPPEEQPSWRERLTSLRAIILPLIVILSVLGTIWGGIATPTEGAGMGVLGAAIAAAVHRKLTWKNLQAALEGTVRLTGMALWIVISGFVFRSMYCASGAVGVVAQLLAAPGSIYITILITQLILIVLGCFLDPGAITMLGVPMFWPVMEILGADQLWFAGLFIMTVNLAYITPPVGFNLFFLRGIAPEGMTMVDIYRSVVPFVFLNLIGLAFVIVFPEIALWLPGILYG